MQWNKEPERKENQEERNIAWRVLWKRCFTNQRDQFENTRNRNKKRFIKSTFRWRTCYRSSRRWTIIYCLSMLMMIGCCISCWNITWMRIESRRRLIRTCRHCCRKWCEDVFCLFRNDVRTKRKRKEKEEVLRMLFVCLSISSFACSLLIELIWHHRHVFIQRKKQKGRKGRDDIHDDVFVRRERERNDGSIDHCNSNLFGMMNKYLPIVYSDIFWINFLLNYFHRCWIDHKRSGWTSVIIDVATAGIFSFVRVRNSWLIVAKSIIEKITSSAVRHEQKKTVFNQIDRCRSFFLCRYISRYIWRKEEKRMK